MTIFGKFWNVKNWMGHPKKETVKNLVGRREYIFTQMCTKSYMCTISYYYNMEREYMSTLTICILEIDYKYLSEKR